MSTRTLRIARFLRSVQYDPVTQKRYRFYERNKPLDKYRGRTDIFGSFTSILDTARKVPRDQAKPEDFAPKLGINPSTKYGTPVGLYAYPVDYLISRYDPQGERFTVPFAGNQEYLHLFQVRNIDRVLVFDQSWQKKLNQYYQIQTEVTPENESLFNQAQILIQEIGEFVDKAKNSWVPQEYQNYFSYMNSEVKRRFQEWYKTVWFPRLLQETGLDQLKDTGLKEFLLDQCNLREKTLWISFLPHGFDISEVKKQVREYLGNRKALAVEFPGERKIRQLPQARNMSDEEYRKLKSYILSKRPRSDPSFIWLATSYLANGDIKVWTGLLRKLGFIGAVDYNTATIFPSEPTQAVFFDPGSIKSLEVIHNKPHSYDAYERDKSKWSRDFSQGIDMAVREVEQFFSRFIRMISSGRYDTDDIKRIPGIFGWLNHHASEDPRWNPSIREAYAQRLETALTDLPDWRENIQKTIFKIITLLRKQK